ncbi:CubicO group peptidase (beta-lactamase class C family) [Bacillus tianshenii]|uniref:CubicO group peptidase (Beta-lactamase class C family) n=1 Tax=Sutcliffiella tianshenii TaxID=1463404 RepID=A0ABS2P4Q7_9BACI|nr:serine hydrolase [Bacillus tianshenii]MBM7621956.1 CubicO group peptidase (beta-lactamase class C family) [Bacillus tianshenii]
MKIHNVIEEKAREIDFSGVVWRQDKNGVVYKSVHGYANRSDRLPNKVETRFGIASGCKLFTAIAIGRLVQEGKLSFETKISEVLTFSDFPHFDKGITVHHLLTHTSGIPDYFEEEEMEDYEDLWKGRPMYQIRQMEDFLPMFQHGEMMFTPGERFHYNNAGFVLLGMVVERVTRESFTRYVEQNIFLPCEMKDSGYFSFDQLPADTATGYIDNEDGTWRSNIYSLPVKGGADGGAYITAPDMAKLWTALMERELLNEEITSLLLTPHVEVGKDEYYGYGIWIDKRNDAIYKYHVMGYDPGVSFASGYYPDSGSILVISSNRGAGPHKLMAVAEEYFERGK